MLMLTPETNYTVEVMLFGGQDINANVNLTIPACSESLRLKITLPTADAPSYNFNGGWVQEQMGSPRVMPDSVILPNGVVILLNGAQAGLAGDSASGGDSRALYPNFYAEMYDPYAPLGGRWTTLARSQIARLYHSTALLTTNGTIVVSGCDRCGKIQSLEPFSPPRVKAEYRQEVFYPPFFFDMASKPVIMTYPDTVFYNQVFTIGYAGEQDPNVDVSECTPSGAWGGMTYEHAAAAAAWIGGACYVRSTLGARVITHKITHPCGT